MSVAHGPKGQWKAKPLTEKLFFPEKKTQKTLPHCPQTNNAQTDGHIHLALFKQTIILVD
jgi:hypothetical protein